MHAVQRALQKLGHRDTKMWWQEGVVGYGLALLRDARDVLRGDDAKRYG